jgi:hypothetical protein
MNKKRKKTTANPLILAGFLLFLFYGLYNRVKSVLG